MIVAISAPKSTDQHLTDEDVYLGIGACFGA
jgi:hypothetical protein